jgi:hypothetical protein
MKKIVRFAAAVVTGIGLSAGVVSAQSSTCTITNTGPDSVNSCTVNDSNVVTITCINGVTATNINVQSAVSGSATVSGNTISGTATSGDAANVNNVATELAQYCAQAPNTPTPSQPPAGGNQGGSQQGAGGQGGGVVAGASTTRVAALPRTGVNSTVNNLGLATAAAGMLGLAAQAGVMAYRRRAFKN